MKYIIDSAGTYNSHDFWDRYSDMLLDNGFKLRVLSEDNKDKAIVIITIKSLKDLMKLIDIVGDIIIYDNDIYREYPKITIYDGYIE